MEHKSFYLRALNDNAFILFKPEGCSSLYIGAKQYNHLGTGNSCTDDHTPHLNVPLTWGWYKSPMGQVEMIPARNFKNKSY